jgi:hypothetical protein
VSIRLRYHVETSVSSSPADTKDLCNVCLSVTSDLLSEGGIWKTRVAAGTMWSCRSTTSRRRSSCAPHPARETRGPRGAGAGARAPTARWAGTVEWTFRSIPIAS